MFHVDCDYMCVRVLRKGQQNKRKKKYNENKQSGKKNWPNKQIDKFLDGWTFHKISIFLFFE